MSELESRLKELYSESSAAASLAARALDTKGARSPEFTRAAIEVDVLRYRIDRILKVAGQQD